ncbi:MAG: IMP cyclohydrolase [Actinobacteria bacterium]|nr:IMP cyclohydrolase [Actinomycetota bacterium]
MDIVKVRRALVSVSDKAGVVEFVKALASMGVTIISTGGTARALSEAGIKVVPVEEVTGFPEMMNGRVKTLHPKVHGGILAVKDNADHVQAMKTHGIESIDMVCVNLYPFEKTVAQPDCTLAEAVENIDIGGPSMIRSAAKNHAFVAVVTDPEQYQDVIEELKANDGGLTKATRAKLALAAFTRTAEYDRAISEYLAKQ